jgi:calcineurin-like phosphoesterase family protein
MRPDYFYSDPHFGHSKIIVYCDRPFESATHMRDEFVRRYNAVVGSNDLVLWCGDASMKISPLEMQEILSALNGRKALIRGNHDGSIAHCHAMGFQVVMDEAFLHMAKRTVRVKHYPYGLTDAQKASARAAGRHIDERYPERRPPRVQGEVLIHGHTHQKTSRIDNQVHVGVDSWDFRPASWHEVEEVVAQV